MTLLLLIITCSLAIVTSREHVPYIFTLGQFYPVNQQIHNPRKSETLSSGAIRDVIKRNSPRYRKVLVRNSNPEVYFTTEDSHFMTSRTKSKLDVLASLFIEKYGVYVKVLLAWTDVVDKADMLSLHYEGRALCVQSSDGRRELLSDLARVAVEAGFDWVYYVNENFIYISVQPDVCQTKLDLAIVVDTSGSIHKDNFEIMKIFLKRLVDYFNIGEDETHVALISYSYLVHIELYLWNGYPKNNVKKYIDRMWYQSSSTRTGDALVAMADSVFNTDNGMRDDQSIPKLGILMTDGYSNGGTSIAYASQKVKEAGINMFVIGITNSPQMSEINLIASQPVESHFVRITEFTDLSHFVDRISMVSCDQGAQMSKCATTETDVEGGSFKYFRIELPGHVEKITIELNDHKGISFMYVSLTITNPGPLSDPKDVARVESPVSPRTVSLTLTSPTGKPNIVYIAVQGQEEDNKFALSIWDSLFPKDSDNVSIYENGPRDEVITTVRTKPSAETFYYRIKDGDPNGMFYLDQDTGVLQTSQSLDREKVSSYQLSIVAIDVNEECHKGLFVLHIDVLDTDDNVPVFQQKGYVASVRENTPSGQYVIQVKATDPDVGTNAEPRYYIDGPSKIKKVFQINQYTGIVRTSLPLDYETTPKYTLQLSVKDMGPLTKRGHAILIISIIDLNEPPYFTSPVCIKSSSCVFEMFEEKPVGTAVGDVMKATDPDTIRCELTFNIISQDQAYFTIGKTSGIITTKERLDREVKEDYVVEIEVMDCGKPKLSEKRSAHIKLLDINDNSPKFSYHSYTIHVREDLNLPSVLPLKLHATDADTGTNAQIHYVVHQKESPGYFTIDRKNGRLTLVKKLDREIQSKIILNVTATDGGYPSRSTHVIVRVILIDVNDNAPQFVGKRVYKIVENVKPGGLVFVAKATDADKGLNAKIRYSMVHGGPMFSIDVNGNVRNEGSPDRETVDTYTLTIMAQDLGSPPLSNKTDYIIKVLDVNDNAPLCDKHYQMKTVKQNITIDTRIAEIQASDPDLGENRTFTFHIDGVSDKFHISEHTGVIQLKDVLNYTKKSFYQLKIKVPDNGTEQLTGYCSVAIKVEDTNDYTPTFSHRVYNKSIEENHPSMKVLKVTATDRDGGTSGEIIYSIIKEIPAAHFSIDSKTGVISTSHPIDYEQYTNYTLSVKAVDKGSPPRSSQTTVEITVIDVNDNAPVMNTFHTSIPEDIAVGRQIGVVTATDKDSGSNGEVWFQSASVGFPFKVTSNGYVTVAKTLDRERTDFYNLRINGSDKGSPPLSTSGFNPIRITDVNDNHPIFTKSHYKCTVMENSITNVCDVKATDRDIGENARISYSIHTNEFFKIHEVTGQVSVLNPIDREIVPEVNVTVNASDHGKPSLSGEAYLHVKVLDVNDNIPYCTNSSYSFTLVEERPDGTVVGEIVATDKDEGSNAEVTFKLVKGHTFNTKQRFFLTQANNKATLKAHKLDYEEHNHYVILVSVTDHGRPSLSSQCTVDVKLIDINDNSPVLSQSKFEQSIKENVGVGTYVLKVSATDKDSGSNSELSYKITSGNNQHHFKLNLTTGALSTAKVLDYDTTARYVFEIEVSDNGNPRRNVKGSIIVNIISVDRTPPAFEKVRNVSVYEDLAVGQSIMQFKATGEGGRKLTFSIVAGNGEDKFAIHKETGLMTLKHPLDRETTDIYNVTVSASDLRKSMNESLPVIVLDINDNAPVFSKPSYSAKFSENKHGDIIKLHATDKDIGTNGEIEFSIISGDIYGEFLIDKRSGIIKVRKTLDRETRAKYILVVEATDKGTPALTSDVSVTIDVQDVNDNPPIFDRSSYSVAVAENTDVSYLVVSVSAHDIDAGNNGTVGYRIKKGDVKSFQINSTSGEMKTKINLDRETKDRYELIIEGYDFGTPRQMTSSVKVTINVTDINDNYPMIISPNTFKPCNESTSVNSKLDIINATDIDIGINADLVYGIKNKGNEQMFTIDNYTGQIYLQSSLDAEEQQSYVVTVTVSDKGTLALSISKDYEFNVLDANDNAPIFTQGFYSGSIEENKEGKTQLFMANATDADVTETNSAITYSLISNDTTGLFEIEPRTGVVSVTRPLDYETIPLYKFEIKAADWKFSVQVPAEVKVINLNDNSPIFERKLYTKTIQENLKLGTYVLTVNATDLDPFGDLHFSLVSTGESLPFAIDSKTGVITVVGELDRETTPWFSFDVSAEDNKIPILNGTARVNITLSDINDNHPLFKSYSKTVKIQENQDAGSYLTTITATDKDIGLNGKVKYYLSKADLNFHIHPDNGRITTKRPYDRELTSILEFHVFARDCGTPSLKSDEFILKVIIGDENDNSPSLLQRYYSVNISENVAIGYKFIDVTATDPDLLENGTVIYEIFHHDVSPFKIKSDSGVVSILHKLDRETVDYYNVTLIAHDNSTLPLSTKCQLYIDVIDVNDNHPVIDPRTLSGQVYENQPKGTKVVKVRATDKDIGTNAELVYEIEKGPGSDLFQIDSSSGQVVTMLALDREEQDRYFLHLIVSDRGVPQLKTTAIINITILDLDDNCPVFKSSVYTTSIVENSPYGYFVTTVSATDADIGTNAILNYGILYSDGRGVFNVEPDTGEVHVSGEVDREFKEVYHLKVRAGTPYCGQTRNESEGEKPLVPNYASTDVFIKVLDVNDNAPTFLNGKEKIIFDQVEKRELYRFNATDPDLGPGGKVGFRLKNVIQDTDGEYIENHITVEAFDYGEVSLVSNETLTVVNHIRCDAMHFFVSSAGVLTVDSLCSVNNTKKDLKMLVGELTYLKCVASGNTKTKYRWIKDGDVASVWTRDGGYLLNNVTQQEEGYYACVASSSAGSIQSSSTALTVHEKPKVLKEPTNIMVDLGGDASFKVVAVGDPKPKYQWHKNNRKIPAWMNPSATHNELIINNTIPEDTGIYNCKISNTVGSVWSRSINVTIVDHADVVSLQVEVNRPDPDGTCQMFSTKQFQKSASKILGKGIVITDISRYSNRFCNMTVCSDNPCKNGGKCTVVDSGYQCTCKSTWIGKNCERDSNECAGRVNICYGSKSKCRNLNGSFSCDCSHELTGHRCEYSKDACIRNKCHPIEELCVPSEEREYACVSKHNLVSLVYNSSVTLWTKQRKYEILDQLNEVIKTQASIGMATFSNSFDYGVCTFHIINSVPERNNKSSPNIYFALDCSVNQTSINLTSSMISHICKLIYPIDNRMSECGEPGATTKPTITKLDPVSAEIHLILESKGSILSASESIDVMNSKKFDRAIQGVTVRLYDHAYKPAKQTGDKEGTGSKTIVIGVVVGIIVVLVIVGVLWFRKNSKFTMLANWHADNYAISRNGNDLINPAYNDNDSLQTDEGCINFTYDVANEGIDWENVKE